MKVVSCFLLTHHRHKSRIWMSSISHFMFVYTLLQIFFIGIAVWEFILQTVGSFIDIHSNYSYNFQTKFLLLFN